MSRVATTVPRAAIIALVLRYTLEVFLALTALTVLPVAAVESRAIVYAGCDLIASALAVFAFFALAGDMIVITHNPTERRGKLRAL